MKTFKNFLICIFTNMILIFVVNGIIVTALPLSHMLKGIVSFSIGVIFGIVSMMLFDRLQNGKW